MIGSGATTSNPLAIRVIRPDITAERTAAEDAMEALADRLGYIAGAVVVVDPRKAGPCATVLTAIAKYHADAVIVPDLEHVDGIDRYIRDRVQLITVDGERVLERTAAAVA